MQISQNTKLLTTLCSDIEHFHSRTLSDPQIMQSDTSKSGKIQFACCRHIASALAKSEHTNNTIHKCDGENVQLEMENASINNDRKINLMRNTS